MLGLILIDQDLVEGALGAVLASRSNSQKSLDPFQYVRAVRMSAYHLVPCGLKDSQARQPIWERLRQKHSIPGQVASPILQPVPLSRDLDIHESANACSTYLLPVPTVFHFGWGDSWIYYSLSRFWVRPDENALLVPCVTGKPPHRGR